MNFKNDAEIRALKPHPKNDQYYSFSKNKKLKIRVWPNGTKVFYLWYTADRKKRRYRMGKYGEDFPKLAVARKKAEDLLAEVQLKGDPHEEKQKAIMAEKQRTMRSMRFKQFLEAHYYPEIKHQRGVAYTSYLLESKFKFLRNKYLNEIGIKDIENHFVKPAYEKNRKSSTINRGLIAIYSCLNKATELEIVETPCITPVEMKNLKKKYRLNGKSSNTVRYLSDDEREAMYTELDTLRGYFPVLIKLLLHTGLRPTEAMTLYWKNIDFKMKQIHLRAEITKTNEQRYVPINSYITPVLLKWRDTMTQDTFVFPSPVDPNRPIKDIYSPWAELMKKLKFTQKFRIYDCRHDFASNLVMSGASIYTVSQLLGHKNVDMTQRYAHLSMQHVEKAVDLIVR